VLLKSSLTSQDSGNRDANHFDGFEEEDLRSESTGITSGTESEKTVIRRRVVCRASRRKECWIGRVSGWCEWKRKKGVARGRNLAGLLYEENPLGAQRYQTIFARFNRAPPSLRCDNIRRKAMCSSQVLSSLAAPRQEPSYLGRMRKWRRESGDDDCYVLVSQPDSGRPVGPAEAWLAPVPTPCRVWSAPATGFWLKHPAGPPPCDDTDLSFWPLWWSQICDTTLMTSPLGNSSRRQKRGLCHAVFCTPLWTSSAIGNLGTPLVLLLHITWLPLEISKCPNPQKTLACGTYCGGQAHCVVEGPMEGVVSSLRW